MMRHRVFWLAWMATFLLCVGWTLATPISGSPDEPAHLVKAASVVRGQFVGELTPLGHRVQVPAYIAQSHQQACYAFDSNATPVCARDVEGDPARLVDGITSAGLYNPLFYSVVGLPSLVFPDASGIYAMRAVGALFASLFIALALGLVAAWRRPLIPVLSIAVAVTPMVAFLCGTVNPNGLEITANLAVFVSMLTIVRSAPGARLTAPVGVLIASGIVVANARGLSLAWLAAALLIPLLLAGWPRVKELLALREVRMAIVGVGTGVALALAWLLGSSSLVAAIDQPNVVNAPYVGASPALGFFFTIDRTFDYALNMIGIFGWLDASAPNGVYAAWGAFVGSLLILAAVLARGRRLIAVLLLAGGVVLLPAIFQGAYVTGGGIVWQGRYTLPLFVCLVFLAGMVVSDRVAGLERRVHRRLAWVVGVTWGLAQAYTGVFVLRRYVVGAGDSWVDMLLRPEWTPPGGLLLTLLVVVGTSGLAAAGLIWLALRSPEVEHDAEAEEHQIADRRSAEDRHQKA